MKKIIPLIFVALTIGAFAIPRVSIVKSVNADDEMIVMDQEQNSVLDGRTFFASHSVAVVTGLMFTFTTPPLVPARLTISATMTTCVAAMKSEVTSVAVVMYESASYNTGTGTLITSYDCNRTTANTALSKVTHSAVALSAASVTFPTMYIPMGAIQNVGSRYNPVDPVRWQLKANTRYGILFTNPGSQAGASALTYNVRFVWHE